MRTGGSMRMRLLVVSVVALVGFAMIGVSCDDDDGIETESGRRVITIEIMDDELQPGEVEIRTPDENFIDVENRADQDCMFSFGPWVNGLLVPANGNASLGFTVTEGPERAEMGCDGGPTGTVIVRESTS